MTTAEDVTKQVGKIQAAISNRYKHLAEECPEAAYYLCDKMKKLLLNNGFLTRVDLKEETKNESI